MNLNNFYFLKIKTNELFTTLVFIRIDFYELNFEKKKLAFEF